MINTNASVEDQKRQLKNWHMHEYFRYMELYIEALEHYKQLVSDNEPPYAYEYYRTLYRQHWDVAEYHMGELNYILRIEKMGKNIYADGTTFNSKGMLVKADSDDCGLSWHLEEKTNYVG